MQSISRSLRLVHLNPSGRRSLFTSHVNLSGHNKWSKIKQKKGVNDAAKGAIYGKANKDIAVAVRSGGSADPLQNQTLAAVIKRVKAQGVPKDNIENALKKAAGGKDKGDQQVTYEAMAAGSVGIVIECLTNNVNRTLHSIRDILTSHGARFAPVGFLFERKGSVRVSLQRGEDYSERLERLIETALEADAEDFEESDAGDAVEVEFICPPSTLSKVTEAVTSPGLANELIGSELVYQPVDAAEPPDEQLEGKISNIVDALEENEDTLRVWTTLD